eukprot:m.36804 g.36804  ORF g.36804 m.36804 type:complete len:249 (+) comp9719_c0_seq4:350-1096(+)
MRTHELPCKLEFREYVALIQGARPLPAEGRFLPYLKDWHCLSEHPLECQYELPAALSDDWLNSFLLQRPGPSKQADFRFIYFGPKGSSTALHVDVLGSFSWSTNIVGKKHWCFWLPNSSPEAAPSLELEQGPGETVFVPSNWPHTVVNLAPTISVNHNWGNSFNIAGMATVLARDLAQVRRELSDLATQMEGWLTQCDALVKVSRCSCSFAAHVEPTWTPTYPLAHPLTPLTTSPRPTAESLVQIVLS